MGDIADQECQRGRTNERRGGDPTNLEASETKIEQVHALAREYEFPLRCSMEEA